MSLPIEQRAFWFSCRGSCSGNGELHFQFLHRLLRKHCVAFFLPFMLAEEFKECDENEKHQEQNANICSSFGKAIIRRETCLATFKEWFNVNEIAAAFQADLFKCLDSQLFQIRVTIV